MTTINEALAEIVDLATSLGYDVMDIDARGEVRLVPHKKNPDYGEIVIRSLFAKSLMEQCLRDISKDAA